MDEIFESEMERDIRYSVVVPAYNAEGTIRECLEALMIQSIPREEYEVIVVDDGSADGTSDIVREYDVEYRFQENRGPAAARNLGVREAKGEFVLFTDADCAPTKDWIEELTRPFAEDSRIVGVKGSYVSHQRFLVARFVQQEYEDRYDLMKRWKEIDFIDTYSAAFRRDVFLRSGGFDTEFRIAMGEDTEFSFRLAALGYRMVFQPSAVVAHNHPSTLRRYLKRKYNAALWRILILKKHPQKIRSDSHTPHLIKFQLLCTLLLPLAFVSPFVADSGFVVSGAVAALISMSLLPPVLKIFRRDTGLGFVAPLFLMLRNCVYLCGVAVGLVKFSR